MSKIKEDKKESLKGKIKQQEENIERQNFQTVTLKQQKTGEEKNMKK